MSEYTGPVSINVPALQIKTEPNEKEHENDAPVGRIPDEPQEHPFTHFKKRAKLLSVHGEHGNNVCEKESGANHHRTPEPFANLHLHLLLVDREDINIEGDISDICGFLSNDETDNGTAHNFYCSFCTYKTENRDSFTEHLMNHVFVCKYCGFLTHSRFFHLCHLQEYHSELGYDSMGYKVCRIEISASRDGDGDHFDKSTTLGPTSSKTISNKPSQEYLHPRMNEVTLRPMKISDITVNKTHSNKQISDFKSLQSKQYAANKVPFRENCDSIIAKRYGSHTDSVNELRREHKEQRDALRNMNQLGSLETAKSNSLYSDSDDHSHVSKRPDKSHHKDKVASPTPDENNDTGNERQESESKGQFTMQGGLHMSGCTIIERDKPLRYLTIPTPIKRPSSAPQEFQRDIVEDTTRCKSTESINTSTMVEKGNIKQDLPETFIHFKKRKMFRDVSPEGNIPSIQLQTSNIDSDKAQEDRLTLLKRGTDVGHHLVPEHITQPLSVSPLARDEVHHTIVQGKTSPGHPVSDCHQSIVLERPGMSEKHHPPTMQNSEGNSTPRNRNGCNSLLYSPNQIQHNENRHRLTTIASQSKQHLDNHSGNISNFTSLKNSSEERMHHARPNHIPYLGETRNENASEVPLNFSKHSVAKSIKDVSQQHSKVDSQDAPLDLSKPKMPTNISNIDLSLTGVSLPRKPTQLLSPPVLPLVSLHAEIGGQRSSLESRRRSLGLTHLPIPQMPVQNVPAQTSPLVTYPNTTQMSSGSTMPSLQAMAMPTMPNQPGLATFFPPNAQLPRMMTNFQPMPNIPFQTLPNVRLPFPMQPMMSLVPNTRMPATSERLTSPPSRLVNPLTLPVPVPQPTKEDNTTTPNSETSNKSSSQRQAGSIAIGHLQAHHIAGKQSLKNLATSPQSENAPTFPLSPPGVPVRPSEPKMQHAPTHSNPVLSPPASVTIGTQSNLKPRQAVVQSIRQMYLRKSVEREHSLEEQRTNSAESNEYNKLSQSNLTPADRQNRANSSEMATTTNNLHHGNSSHKQGERYDHSDNSAAEILLTMRNQGREVGSAQPEGLLARQEMGLKRKISVDDESESKKKFAQGVVSPVQSHSEHQAQQIAPNHQYRKILPNKEIIDGVQVDPVGDHPLSQAHHFEMPKTPDRFESTLHIPNRQLFRSFSSPSGRAENVLIMPHTASQSPSGPSRTVDGLVDLPNIKRKPGRPPGTTRGLINVMHGQPANTSPFKMYSKRGPKPGHCTRGPLLWHFFKDLLLNPSTCPSLIRWENRNDGVFRIIRSEDVAKLWGMKKKNPIMTYENLSRAMRFARTAGYFADVPKDANYPKKLCFRFGPKTYGWKEGEEVSHNNTHAMHIPEVIHESDNPSPEHSSDYSDSSYSGVPQITGQATPDYSDSGYSGPPLQAVQDLRNVSVSPASSSTSYAPEVEPISPESESVPPPNLTKV